MTPTAHFIQREKSLILLLEIYIKFIFTIDSNGSSHFMSEITHPPLFRRSPVDFESEMKMSVGVNTVGIVYADFLEDNENSI